MKQRHGQRDDPLSLYDPTDEIGALATIEDMPNHLDTRWLRGVVQLAQAVFHVAYDPGQHLFQGRVVEADIAVAGEDLPDDRFNGAGQRVGVENRRGRVGPG